MSDEDNDVVSESSDKDKDTIHICHIGLGIHQPYDVRTFLTRHNRTQERNSIQDEAAQKSHMIKLH